MTFEDALKKIEPISLIKLELDFQCMHCNKTMRELNEHDTPYIIDNYRHKCVCSFACALNYIYTG